MEVETSIEETKPESRRVEFTEEIFTEICERMSEGKTLREICKDPDMPNRATVLRWVKHDDGRKRQYEFARQAQCDFWADVIVELSRDRTNDIITDKDGKASANHAAVQRDRLICDNYKFLMGKLHPGRYGDKTQIELPQPAKPMQISWIQRTIVDPGEPALKERIKELEEQLAGRIPALTFDREPLPGGLTDQEWSIMREVLTLVKRTIPSDDDSTPVSILRIIREALLLHFREVEIDPVAVNMGTPA